MNPRPCNSHVVFSIEYFFLSFVNIFFYSKYSHISYQGTATKNIFKLADRDPGKRTRGLLMEVSSIATSYCLNKREESSDFSWWLDLKFLSFVTCENCACLWKPYFPVCVLTFAWANNMQYDSFTTVQWQ